MFDAGRGGRARPARAGRRDRGDRRSRRGTQALTASSVLFLHGIGAAGASWQRAIARLGADYACLAPDLPGYGDAPDPDGPPALETIVDAVAAHLAGPAHVVGVSFGALIALALARRRPELVRSLVLADATLGRGALPADERARWLEHRRALAADLDGRADERAREIAGPTAAPDALAEIAANMRRARPSGYTFAATVIAQTDARPWLETIAVPTLVVCGSDDAVVGLPLSQNIAERIPGARLATIAGAGHAPHVERPDEFARAVGAFLDGVEEPGRVVRVALAGAGAIANALIDGIARGDGGCARLVTLGARSTTAALERRAAQQAATLTNDFANLGARATLVIEAAGPAVVRSYARDWLASGADVMVLSAGALTDPGLRADLRAAARAAGRRLLVPSGAIAALDGVRAGALDGLHAVRLRTTKPPAGLRGAPHVVTHAIDLDALRAPATIFEGTVTEAVAAFPSNVNVAAVLALAGGSADVRVSVVADPQATANTHEIEAEGAFGRFSIRLDNRPSPANPKTSALAPLSALAMLRRLTAETWIGS